MSSQRFPDGRDAFSFADMTEAMPQVPSAGIPFVFPSASSSGFQHSKSFLISSANNGGFQYSAIPQSVVPVFGQPSAPTPRFSLANTNATLPQVTWGYDGIPGQNPQTFAIPSVNNVGFQYSGSASAFHRPSTSAYIAQLMSTLFGAVAYAEIDVDTDFKYPKGAACVAFYEDNSYVATVQKGFIDLSMDGMEKKAEIKAYVMDNQPCDEYDGSKCNKCAAPYFSIDHSCLQYYCRPCWYRIHSQRGKENHKMLQREPVVVRRF